MRNSVLAIYFYTLPASLPPVRPAQRWIFLPTVPLAIRFSAFAAPRRKGAKRYQCIPFYFPCYTHSQGKKIKSAQSTPPTSFWGGFFLPVFRSPFPRAFHDGVVALHPPSSSLFHPLSTPFGRLNVYVFFHIRQNGKGDSMNGFVGDKRGSRRLGCFLLQWFAFAVCVFGSPFLLFQFVFFYSIASYTLPSSVCMSPWGDFVQDAKNMI